MEQPGRLRRTLRNLFSTRNDMERAFPPAALRTITEAITAGERTHRGEVRLIVEKGLPPAQAWAGVTTRQRAVALFADYGIWDTEENCGVLIYVNLAERKVDIVADRGIDRRIAPGVWQGVCDTMTRGFARGEFEAGALAAVERVNGLLREHFPADGARPNELPDEPLML